MQFVIFMELVGTLALPAAISFTLYLIVMACLGQPALIPLILLALILGLPAVLIVMTSRKIVYVGWMLVYLISLPIWNFVLPTYAYWHFDDFSWGDTRKVEGAESDKKGGHADKDGEFDSSVITMKKWSEYEKERRTKEAMERNMPIPRFMPTRGSSIDVFRDSAFVKRSSKTGSAGSNDSDVPLTQMGYVPARNQAHIVHNNDGITVDNLIAQDNRRGANVSSSVGPDIPLTTIHSPEEPRARYHAGLTITDFDNDNEEEVYDHINNGTVGNSTWSDPYHHSENSYQTKSTTNIPIPPPHDNNLK
jgi:chitin synthase